MVNGVNLIDYKLTPNQAALIEWLKAHPYGRIREIRAQDGVPVEAVVYTDDGTGTELVRFDKFAKQAGLLKEHNAET
jgi:hypothetical protein